MHPYLLTVFRFSPILSVCFTIWVCFTIYMLLETTTFWFSFLTFQFYANWILILLSNNPWGKTKTKAITCKAEAGDNLVWFCRKCEEIYAFNVEHCPLCRKCTELRDHHCFFLGTCITLNTNMKYFMVILLYISITCAYFATILLPFLSEQHQLEQELTNWNLVSKFVYPVLVGRWLCGYGKMSAYLLSLSTMFGLLVSIGCTIMGFFIYQFYRIISGKMYKYKTPTTNRNAKENIKAIFGKWGVVLHIFFPFPSTHVTQTNFHMPIHQS